AKLSIDSASGADAVPYRAQARDGYNRVIGEHLALPNGNQAGAGFDISGLPSWMQNALAYQPQDGADGAASSNNDHKSTQTDPSNVRVLSSPYFAPGASPLQPTRASPPQNLVRCQSLACTINRPQLATTRATGLPVGCRSFDDDDLGARSAP